MIRHQLASITTDRLRPPNLSDSARYAGGRNRFVVPPLGGPGYWAQYVQGDHPDFRSRAVGGPGTAQTRYHELETVEYDKVELGSARE